METGLLIADLEMSFTTSFKHTAQVKWNVCFDNSNINEVVNKLEQLHHNLTSNTPQPVHVGYDITLNDVERVQALINELLQRWKQQTNIPPPAKLYTFLHQLEEMETPTLQQLTLEALRGAFTPTDQPTKKAQKQAEIKALKQQRALEMLRKQNKKN